MVKSPASNGGFGYVGWVGYENVKRDREPVRVAEASSAADRILHGDPRDAGAI